MLPAGAAETASRPAAESHWAAHCSASALVGSGPPLAAPSDLPIQPIRRWPACPRSTMRAMSGAFGARMCWRVCQKPRAWNIVATSGSLRTSIAASSWAWIRRAAKTVLPYRRSSRLLSRSPIAVCNPDLVLGRGGTAGRIVAGRPDECGAERHQTLLEVAVHLIRRRRSWRPACAEDTGEELVPAGSVEPLTLPLREPLQAFGHPLVGQVERRPGLGEGLRCGDDTGQLQLRLEVQGAKRVEGRGVEAGTAAAGWRQVDIEVTERATGQRDTREREALTERQPSIRHHRSSARDRCDRLRRRGRTWGGRRRLLGLDDVRHLLERERLALEVDVDLAAELGVEVDLDSESSD